MLTIAKVTQGQAAGYAEYLDGRSVPSSLGDYYLKDGDRVEAPGRWAGGALAMGADGERPVAGDQLQALMAVRRPDNSLPLRLAGASGDAVAAIDATFSAPKSVSSIWAVGGSRLREQIERAQERAVDRALAYATRTMAMVRERLDRENVIHSRAREVVATSWRHTTARTVNGRPPDPQLHSHVLLHAAIRRDGQVVAIDSRSWLVHRREVGAAYRTELARELAQLGFAIERGTGRAGRYFEVQGVPAEVIDRWSSRHWQVQEAIEARLRDKRTGRDGRVPVLTPAEDRHLTRSSRAAKQTVTMSVDLDSHWTRTASELGFDRGAIQAARRSAGVAPDAAVGLELLSRLTEFDATFAEREARAVALEASAGASISQALERLRELRCARELLALEEGRTTTRAHRAAERRTLAVAQRLATARVDAVPAGLVEYRIEQLDRELRAQGANLSTEQCAAIALACSERQLVVIEGHAGSGKSTTLRAVARAHRDAGQEIIVTSTAALAAQRLAGELRQAGVDTRSCSTVAFDAARRSGSLWLGPSTTVVWDEAALASTREQERLLEAIEISGARVILLGDPRQSQAVAAGGLWPDLEHMAARQGTSIELQHNVRARDPHDRGAQREFREGHYGRALENYAKRGRIHITAEQHQAEDAALDAAHVDRCSGLQTLVIAQTPNEHLDQLNARAQAIRAASGELGKDGIVIAGKPYQLHQGDEVQVRHTIRHPQYGRLSNGTTADVIGIDPDPERVVLALADGREIALQRGLIDQADIRLAYVQHPFPAQGRTTDTAHLIVAGHITSEGAYVAITRARHQTHIHTSREQLDIDETDTYLEPLAQRVGRAEPEIPSIRYPLARETHIQSAHVQERDSHGQARSTNAPPDHHYRREIYETSSEQRPVAALGPRASAPQNPANWRHGTHAVEQSRTRSEIDPPELAGSGLRPTGHTFSQRYEQRQAVDGVLEGLARLDPADPSTHAIQERALQRLGLSRHRRQGDRTASWEP